MSSRRHRARCIVQVCVLGLLIGALPHAASAQTSIPPERGLQDPELVTRVVSTNVVRIEYRPASLRLDTVFVDNSLLFRILFNGATYRSPFEDAGLPDVPHRVIPLAFPSLAGGDVRIIAADYEEVRGIHVRPVPTLKDVDGMPTPSGYAGRNDVPAGMFPERIATLTAPARVRSAAIGGLQVWPVQYDAVSRTVRKYSRIVLEVTCAGGEPDPVRSADVSLLARTVANPALLRRLEANTPAIRKTAATSSVLASGDWYRLTVSEEGMYKIDAAFLSAAGIAVAAIDPRTIKIYGNGGKEIPENVLSPRPSDLEQIAILVEGESDGQFGSGDYVLFYGRGTRGLAYDSASRTVKHYINRYSEVNYYWLTFGGANGKRMASQASLATDPDIVVEQFEDLIYNEEEKVNLLNSGKDWLGQSLSGPSSSFTYVNVLPGLVTGSTIKYRYALVAHDETVPRFTVKDGGTTLGTHYLGSAGEYLYATGSSWASTGPSSLANATSQLSVTFTSSTSASQGWVDWFEIQYPRMLWGVNNALRFRSPDTSAVAEFRLQQFTAMPGIYNVSEHANVRVITGVSGSYMFRDALVPGAVQEYFAATQASWKTPSAITRMENQNLHGWENGAEYIIVTSPEFLTAANTLAAHRQQAAHGGLKTLVVNVNLVYNEFGGGIPDVTALRDFLKFAYENWTPQPEFVLFFGGASFDYKGLLGSKSSFVPTWQSPESRHDVSSYSTDDYFTAFAPGMIPFLVGGRIAVRTATEANAVVQKIIRYDTQSARDAWKTRMLFIGDDSWTSEGEEGTMHSDDAEAAASTAYTPDEIEKKKIYLAEYPTVYAAQGRRKPGAAQDLVDYINQGVLVLNYSGHGNPKVWAHEQIFEVTTTIPQFTNASRLPMFFLATCNFSQFDNPQSYSGAELLLNKSDGGASAVISASRKVYASGNAELNKGMYARMFGRDTYGRVAVERPATALFLYKAIRNDVNDQKFFFMGDPAMHLAYPTGFASIDSINGLPVDSLNGAPRTSPIALKALSRVTFAGTVRDAANRPDTSFNGTLSLRVNDVSRRRTILNFVDGISWSYLATGGTIYRGESSVATGRFRATFVVPKDITYADTTGRGRLMAYITRPADDGTGFTNVIQISGTDSTAAVDHEGPHVQIALNNRSFSPGDVVGENPRLLVDLRDSSGINTSTAGIGHRIEAWLNNGTESLDLTEHYSSTKDDYREGSVEMELPNVKAGRNTIRVRAWDSYNNSSSAETYFVVAASDQLSIVDLFNYPNPFADETQFTFRHNQTEPLDVQIKVYTVAGRLIQDMRTVSAGEMMVRVPWDGRDRDGDKVANGVYLYKVLVRTLDGRFASEAVGKLAVVR